VSHHAFLTHEDWPRTVPPGQHVRVRMCWRACHGRPRWGVYRVSREDRGPVPLPFKIKDRQRRHW
jgi:hypothetical protein